MNTITKISSPILRGLDFAAPIGDLILRLWVSYVFFSAGLVKLMNMESTVWLFTYEYQVPIISPVLAAYLGTIIELIFPVLLAIGLFSRFSALVLFVYNLVAAFSYPGLTHNGFECHMVWGIMLLVIILRGPGKLSIDHFLWNKIAGNDFK